MRQVRMFFSNVYKIHVHFSLLIQIVQGLIHVFPGVQIFFGGAQQYSKHDTSLKKVLSPTWFTLQSPHIAIAVAVGTKAVAALYITLLLALLLLFSGSSCSSWFLA